MMGTGIVENIDSELRYKLSKARPNLKESTIRNYMITLGKIDRTINKEKLSEAIGTECLKNVDKFKEYIDTLKSDNTKKNAYNIAVVFLMSEADDDNTELIDVYTKERDILNKKYVDFNATHEKTERQEKNWMSYEELENIAKSYKNTDFQKYAILTFHLNIALRNDLQSLRVMTEKQYNEIENKIQVNAIIKMTPKMKLATGNLKEDYVIYLNNYKTSGAYKFKRILVPAKLSTMIKKLILNNSKGDENPDNYLVLNNGKPFKSNEFTRYFNKILAHTGKKISTTLLRNIVLSHRYGDTVKEMKQVAKDMCHSDNTQKMYIKY